jgi:hypothetical protein
MIAFEQYGGLSKQFSSTPPECHFLATLVREVAAYSDDMRVHHRDNPTILLTLYTSRYPEVWDNHY